MDKHNESSSGEERIEFEEKYFDYEYPMVSIVIPIENSAQTISRTMENLLAQVYPNFEIILVDASSTDRTLEIIKNYHSDKIRIYSVSKYHCMEMLNKGSTLAKGVYLCFLFPGDYYTSVYTLKHVMTLALDHEMPDLIYCGTLMRDGKTEVRILKRPLTLENLKHGHQPTSAQSCWFRNDTFRKLGKFNTTYQLRGTFEYLCRFMTTNQYRAVASKRVLTDYDLRFWTWKTLLIHFNETILTLYEYFGPWTAFRWLFYQKHWKRIFKLFLHNLKVAFFGR